MPDFGIMRGFNEKLFGDKLVAGQLPTQLGLIGSQEVADFDADAIAFFGRVTTAGGSLSATEKAAVNTLVVDMKAAGIWTSMKAIYPMVGASAAACAQNLKSSSFTGAFTSGWTFTAEGIRGNLGSAYMDTALNDLNDLGASATIGCYINSGGAGAGWDLGIFQSPYIVGISVNNSGSTYINIKTNVNVTLAEPTFIGGFYLGTSNGTTSSAYKNATFQNSQTQTTTGFNFKHYIGALNNGGAAFLSNDRRNAFTFYANSTFTGTNVSNLYTAVQTFQTTLSRQV
jgi:hypothetical protein